MKKITDLSRFRFVRCIRPEGYQTAGNRSPLPTDPRANRGEHLAVAHKCGVNCGRRFSVFFLQSLEKFINLVGRSLGHAFLNLALKFI
jgi:hypothetical protein